VINDAQVPPHSPEHERIVLGTALTNPDRMPDLREYINADAFYVPRHRETWRALEHLDDQNLPIDVQTVIDELKRRQKFELLSAEPVYFAALAEAALPSTVIHFARLVREYAALRALEFETRAINRECLDLNPQQGLDVEHFLQDAESRVFRICERGPHTTVRTAAELAESAMEIFEGYRQGRTPAASIKTGLRDLDSSIAIEPGMFVIVAGRPSMGKTSLLVHLALEAANAGKAVFISSLETVGAKVAVRAICNTTKTNLWRVRERQLHPDEWKALAEAALRFGDLPLQLDEAVDQTMSTIRSKARRMARGGKLGLVCIDYLQLVRPERGRDIREREVAEISRAAKALAMELSVPVLMAAQLNRKSEARDERTPQLSDLRESGSLEQDADIVLLIHRPEFYEPGLRPSEADIIVAKQRDGDTDTVTVKYDRAYTRFSDCESGG
jgi:replicative DNA helicase